jgi:hypothetical protein
MKINGNFFFVFLKLDIKSYIKGSANYYRRGAIHIRQDLCRRDNDIRDLILLMSPVVKDMLSKVFKPCPYSVSS